MPPNTPLDADTLARHAAFVRAVARATLKDDDALDDVVQETVLAALLSGPRRAEKLGAWLAGIARRQAAARIRKASIRRRGDPHAARPEAGESTLEVAVRVETARRVVGAVMALDEPYRSAVLLRYYDDLPPRRIAARKQVPVETVRTWIKRGLKQLRARLERDHASERGGWRAALLPLAASPQTGSALTTSLVLGGVLVMKKLAALAAVLLLVAGGVLWWSPDGERGTEYAEVVGEATPDAPAAPTPPPTPILKGRAGPTVAEPTAASWAEAPFRGRVVDADGAPLPGVRVGVRKVFCREANGNWVLGGQSLAPSPPILEVRTDEGGRFAFPSMPGGGEEDPARPSIAMDVHADLDGHASAHVQALRDQEATLCLHPCGTLALRVLDAGGRPVPKARIEILMATGGDAASFLALPAMAKKLATNDDGRAETFLPAGRYRVRARSEGQAPVAAGEVVVEVGRRTEHVVRLGAGPEILLRVIGPDDEKVAGARVHLRGPLHSTAQGVTDAEGRCRITGIARPEKPGNNQSSRLRYRVVAEGYALRTGTHPLTREEDAAEVVEIRLVRGVPVRLHVVDAVGAPLARVRVLLEWEHQPIDALRFWGDANGWVTLPRLAPGTVGLLVLPDQEGYRMTRIDLRVRTEALERDVVLEAKRERLAGRVRMPDGAPATEGRVGVAPLDGDRGGRLVGGFARIQPDGRFELTNLKSGRQFLVAAVPGYLPQWREIEVVRGSENGGVILDLEQRGRVQGRVLGWDDVPLADAEVHLQVDLVLKSDGRDMHRIATIPIVKTDANGRFRILGVDDHPLKPSITCAGWVPAWPWPETLQAGDEDAVFVMKPASEGSGMGLLAHVTADGLPYDGPLAVAVLDPGRGNPVGMPAPVSRGDGLYDVRILLRAPGRFDLRFRAAGRRPVEVRGVEIRHRPPRPEIDVRLGPRDSGATLVLRVVTGDGSPFADRWIHAGPREVKTDANGEAKVDGFKPGTLEHFTVVDPADRAFTFARFDDVRVPGTLDVVLRRCGRIRVTTPFTFAALEHALVFRAIDADGVEVDRTTVPADRHPALDRQVFGYLQVFADGTYTVVLETDGRRVEGEVEARIGHEVTIALDPR